jgi:L-alanine-DL-glutamate epimerase-like enolase superfamily enzyme
VTTPTDGLSDHTDLQSGDTDTANRELDVSPPGVPLEDMTALPGTAVIRQGRVRPTDAPGLGFDISRDWLESRTV